ncbi:MAG: TolC family protein [Proteobacteria bacterium]|nr:TolC family protein [Pseudomonadota bacterium]
MILAAPGTPCRIRPERRRGHNLIALAVMALMAGIWADGADADGPGNVHNTDFRGALAAAGQAAASTQAQAILAPPPEPGAESPGASARVLTLEEAHAIALKNHPGIAAADYRALAATEVFKQARSGLLPQANLYGSFVRAGSEDTRIMAGGLNNPSVFDRTAFGVGVSQLITDFGRTTNLSASTKLQAHAEDQAAQTTREQVLLGVDRSYFAVLQAQAVENVAQQTVNTRQLLLDRVTILAQNKLKSDLDVSFASVALQDARLLLQRAQNDFDSSMASLSTILGFREQQHFTLQEDAPPPIVAEGNLAALTDRALQDRPELGTLRDQRDAAIRLAQSLRDSRLPTISAVVAAGDAPSHDARLPDNYSAGGIQISVPLFAGGFYLARQHEAELRAKAAGESLRTVEDEVTRDVRIAWLSLNNARERLRTSQQLSRYAATAYQLADARYRAGSSSIVELSQAQLELTSAQIGETVARYDVLVQQSALSYESGAMLQASAALPR